MGRAFEPLRNHFGGRNEGCSRIPRFFASGRDGTSVFTGRKIAVGQKRTDRTKCRCRVSCVGFRTGMFAGRVGAWRNVRFFLRLCEDGPVLYGIWYVTCCYRMYNGIFVFADMRFFCLEAFRRMRFVRSLSRFSAERIGLRGTGSSRRCLCCSRPGAQARYSFGVRPTTFLNRRVKCCGYWKPSS